METQIIQNSIFKFVALRQPQKVDPKKKKARFTYDDRDTAASLVLSTISQALDQGGGEREVLEALKVVVSESGYTPDPPDTATAKKFAAIQRLAEKHLIKFISDQFKQELADILENRPERYMKTEDYVATWSGIWDRLYAFFLLDRETPYNLENLVSGLQLLHLIAYAGEQDISNVEELRTVYRSVPVLPVMLFQLPLRAPQPGPRGAVAVGEVRAEDVEAKKPSPWEEFLDVHRAVQEVRELASETVDHFKKAKAPMLPAQPNMEAKGELAKVIPSTAQNTLVWAFNQEAVRKLSPETQVVLRRLEIEPNQVEVPRLVQRLEERLSAITEKLFEVPTTEMVRAAPPNAMEIPGVRALKVPMAYAIAPAPQVLAAPVILPAPGTVRPLGIGDLKVVRQKLIKYASGEAAHIENVLKGESKERKHRRLERTEEIFVEEKEVSQETERDSQSTERFELKREAQKTIESDMSLSAGLSVSASYGSVQVTAQANFATSNSASESTRNASLYAKDVTERSLSKLQERTREERVRRLLHEIEEINQHAINNTGGNAEHVTGIYRWVDKYYKAQVYNYGKRLMFEFIVPQPAAFYIYAQDHKPEKGVTVQLPPELGNLTHKDIQPWNYHIYVRKYNVQGVSVPPPLYRVIGTSLTQASSGAPGVYTASNKELQVPKGYRALSASIPYSYLSSPAGTFVHVLVGNRWLGLPGNGYTSLNNEDSIIPVSVNVSVMSYALNIEVLCERAAEGLEDWQLKTFEDIQNAYQVMKTNYDEAVAAKQASQGVAIAGKNPQINRMIEKEELKKRCLTMLTEQDFSIFGAMQDNVQPYGYPEIDVLRARSEGKYIQFFEQAFEWEQITYLFYPYFWGKKNKWTITSNYEDTDPFFTKFLQAGAARVVVPVRPAYEAAILHYLESNGTSIWNGGEPPVVNDELYLSIVDELKSQQDLSEAVAEGDPWEVVIPTTLVYLQADSDLPTWKE